MANERNEKPSYLDENLTESEKQDGRTRVPSPEQEGEGKGKTPGEKVMNPQRPDEFGDGDRRS